MTINGKFNDHAVLFFLSGEWEGTPSKSQASSHLAFVQDQRNDLWGKLEKSVEPCRDAPSREKLCRTFIEHS